MRLSIKEHKTPIAVTVVGVLVATGLATAPLIMADSPTDKLASQNSAEVEKLTARFDTESQSASGKFSNLDNQISILNKATSRLHLRQKKMLAAEGPSLTEVAKRSSNTESRVLILEKAVSNLHRKQQALKKAPIVEKEPAAAPDTSAFDERLAFLEQTVKDLQATPTIDSTENSTENPVSTADEGNQADNTRRIQELESTIANISQQQRILNSTKKAGLETNVRKNVETDIKIRSLERSLARLSKRIDTVESSSRPADPVADQLYEIRDTVDLLLNEISKRR